MPDFERDLLLRDPGAARVYADVCEAEAELLDRLGRAAECDALRRRAGAIREAAIPG